MKLLALGALLTFLVPSVSSAATIANVLRMGADSTNYFTASVDFINSANSQVIDSHDFDVPYSGVSDASSRQAAMQSSILSYSTSHSYGVGANSIIWSYYDKSLVAQDIAAATSSLATQMATVPMYVNGVAKTGYSAASGTATVAGGSGVARFYLDSNNDGTGTALYSEVYATTVQAYVLNSANVYIPSAVSVDGSRKYVDITMKQQAFSSTNALVSLLGALASFVTGQTFGAAPNGTVLNVLLIGKQ